MVKAVVGEETQLKLAEDRLSQTSIPSEVGLVIGRLSSSLDRGFVFDLIPTPPNDAGQPACWLVETARDEKKKGSKGKAQPDLSVLSIDNDWVVEHARQVSRMLVGGIKVVGIYTWVSETIFKNCTVTLCQTVKGVAEAAPLAEADWDERLLIHISYSPRRWTCRNCTLASNITSSSLRPCDFKLGKVLNSLLTLRCNYNFELRLPICLDSGSKMKRLADHLRQGILNHAKELKGARALIDGKLVTEDEPCVSDGSNEVQFLLPFLRDGTAQASSQGEVVGVLVLSGSVCSFAYINSREPLSQALDDIKRDVIVSLQSRLDIIRDEAERELDSSVDGNEESNHEISSGQPVPHLDPQFLSLRKQYSLPFPRRVFVPWLAGTYICDYIQSNETLEVLKDHCVELMSMKAPTDISTILDPETEAPNLAMSTSKSFWDIAVPISSVSEPSKSKNIASQESDKKFEQAPMFKFVSAFLALILSILVGLVLYVFKG